MTEEGWDALLLDIPEEVKKWFALIGHGEGANHHDPRLNLSLAEGSNKPSYEEDDKKEV